MIFSRVLFWPTTGFFFLTPVLLKYNWHITFYKFKIYNTVVVLDSQSCPILCNPTECSSPGSSLCPWDSPGKNIGVSCHSLLQGTFPIQGSNPGLPRFFTIWATREAEAELNYLLAHKALSLDIKLCFWSLWLLRGFQKAKITKYWNNNCFPSPSEVQS